MGFFTFFNRKKAGPVPYDLLKADMHSHFIPGIDDGAPDEETAVRLISRLHQLGYRKIITTPHVMADHYRNTSEMIRSGAEKVRNRLQEENIPVEFEAAAEYYLDHELMKLVSNRDLLTFGKNYLLFELPFFSAPDMLGQLIFELQLAAYKPVLAHPERYSYWHRDFDKYREWFDKGVILQVNLLSLGGHYGPEVKKTAEELIQQGLVSMVGSDCHHEAHIEMLSTLRSQPLIDLISSGKLLNASL